jgi:phosphate transport system substrate-binding protein
MKRILGLYVTFIIISTISTLAQAAARDTIKIVGSSTVYPFATVVAERFGKKTEFNTPVIESTGSGGGLKLFCKGIGVEHPDITNASRRIKQSEIDNCAKAGINEITEIKIGYDGIVIANSRKGQNLSLTKRQIFLALSPMIPSPSGKEVLIVNPHKTWSDVDPSLPNIAIEVLGPPPSSGTRDAFAELAMEGGCKTFKWLADIKKQDKNRYKGICRSVREDGPYIEVGENDNLIVSKLNANPNA